MLRGTAREAAAEFLGTFVLIVFGTAVVAQVVLSGQTHGGYLSINIGWGLAVTMGVYVAGGVSGAHLNPAVTVAAAVHRGFPWSKVLPYCAAQIAGAFTASAVTFLTYRAAFARFDGGIRQVTGPRATAGIFATYPQEFLRTVPDGLIDQVVGTALLIALIFALTDQRNLAPEGRLAPVLFGLLVILIGMTFGFNAGYAINPARDLGPRLFTFLAGWGGEVFRAGNHWWWVPIVGPLVGGVIGGAVYDRVIGRHHPAEDRKREAA
jgi:MIP family channel proteins